MYCKVVNLRYAPFDEKSVATVGGLDTQKKCYVMFRPLRVSSSGNMYVTMSLRESKYEWNNAICRSAILSCAMWIKLCPKVLRLVSLQARKTTWKEAQSHLLGVQHAP